MKCRKCRDQLLSFLEGSLSGSELAKVEDHLAVCLRCRGFALHLKEALALVDREMVIEPSPYFYTRVKARLQEHKQPERERIAYRILQPAFFSMLLLLAIFTGIQLGKMTSSETVANETTVNYFPWMNEIEGEPIETFLMKQS